MFFIFMYVLILLSAQLPHIVSSDEAHAGGTGDTLTHFLKDDRNEREGSSSKAHVPLPELYLKKKKGQLRQ